MPEGEKNFGEPVVKGGQNLPSLVGIGLTDLQNGPPCSSGITDNQLDCHFMLNYVFYLIKEKYMFFECELNLPLP